MLKLNVQWSDNEGFNIIRIGPMSLDRMLVGLTECAKTKRIRFFDAITLQDFVKEFASSKAMSMQRCVDGFGVQIERIGDSEISAQSDILSMLKERGLVCTH